MNGCLLDQCDTWWECIFAQYLCPWDCGVNFWAKLVNAFFSGACEDGFGGDRPNSWVAVLSRHSVIRCVDNSGAKYLKILTVFGGFSRRAACLGDMVTAVPRRLLPVPNYLIRKSKYKKVVRKKKYLTLLVATRRQVRRLDGASIKFSGNAGICFLPPAKFGPYDKSTGIPQFMGSRLYMGLPRELKRTPWEYVKYKRPLYFVQECI